MADIEEEDHGLAAARYLLYELEEGPPDVLVFGESTLTFVGSEEPDQRSLADLLVERFSPRSTFVVALPGFGAEVHTQLVRLAATRTPRPIVVTTLYARGTLPAFRRHPLWGHRRQIELLTSASGVILDDLKGPHVPPTAAEFKAYEAMPYPTCIEEQRTIADFMAELRPPRNPFSPEHMRWLFEFHLGGTPDQEAVAAFTEYGRTLRDAGFPVIAFQNPVSVTEAAGYLGPELLDWHRHNTELVRDAFVAGYGPGAVILDTAEGWVAEDFIEPAVEHLAAHARVRLADAIAEAVESTAGLRDQARMPSRRA